MIWVPVKRCFFRAFGGVFASVGGNICPVFERFVEKERSFGVGTRSGYSREEGRKPKPFWEKDTGEKCPLVGAVMEREGDWGMKESLGDVFEEGTG